MGDDFLDLASVLHFVKADWIGLGRRYLPGVLYTPPPIPVGFRLFQPELLEFLESGGLFFVCSFPYVD